LPPADNAATSAITKTSGVAETWDAGAVSVSPTQTIASGDGYVEATVDALNSWRMVGLSHGDTDQSNTDIDFAAYMAHNVFKASEGGVIKATITNLAVGDKVRVAVENGLVRYYINNTAVYTSTATPTYPLLVDTSILTAGKKISGVVLCAPCHVYYYHQDHLGSVRALTDSTARVVATYNYDAYGRRNYTNNNGVGATASAGNIYNQPVSWTNAISVTSAPTLTFNTIQRTGGPDNVWNAGAVSTQQIRGGDGYVEVRLESTLTYRQIGLSHGDSNQTDSDIDYAAYLRATDLKVIEGGVEKYWLQQVLVAGDVVRVAVEGGKVKYYINSTAVYTSTAYIDIRK
jgi:hypothetical protein